MDSEIFMCDVCSKSVDTQGKFNRHLKTHSKPFQCDKCQRGFALRSDLNRHVKARHRVGSEQYHCHVPNCMFSTTRKDNLSRHLRRYHRNLHRVPEDGGSLKTDKKRKLPESLFPSPSNTGPERIYSSAMLMRAATLGNITLLQACLQAGIALDSKVDDGSTALHCAARAGQTLTVKLLIEMGADVGTTDIKSRSPLVQAILSGNPDTTNVLFENTTQGNLGKQMCHLENALARSGSIEIIENYIKSLQVTLESVDVVRILSIASSLGQDTTVAALLRRSNVDVNSLEYKGNAPIHAAARNGHTKVMELLLASDRIDLNVKTKRFQVTALHIATTRGHLELIKQLIDHEDVNVNCTDFYGRVPLHLSTEHGHLAVTDLLLRDKRTNTGCLDRLKQSPLQLAAFEQHWGVVDLLLSYHEDPRSYSLIQDLSPYQEAFVKADVVKRLLDHADFRDPSMLLHCVAEKGNCDVIQILSAQQSIDMNADCGWLGTPLMVTVFYNQIEAAKLLLRDKEIDVNRKFIGQNTALYWAKLRHHAKMVDLLLSHGATSGENDPPWPPASNEKASNIPPTTTPSAPKNNALESDHEVELEDLSDNDMDDMATAELDEFMSREHREMKE